MGLVDHIRRGLGQLKRLLVHHMIFDPFDGNRLERPRTDMERQPGNLNATVADLGQDIVCEMQPCRRRRHCSRAICIDCLISLLVIGFRLAFDVRGQRDFAVSFHDGEDIFLVESDIKGTIIQISAFNDESAAVFPIEFDSRP